MAEERGRKGCDERQTEQTSGSAPYRWFRKVSSISPFAIRHSSFCHQYRPITVIYYNDKKICTQILLCNYGLVARENSKIDFSELRNIFRYYRPTGS